MPASLSDLLASTVARLAGAGAHDESLGTFKPSRGVAIFRTSDSFVPAGRAWRLGVLLLDASANLYLTGEVTRAVEPGRAAVNRSPAGEERRAYRMAASHSRFPAGEVVNFNYIPIATDDRAIEDGTGPLPNVDGRVAVQIDPSSGRLGIVDLERYLAERVALLLGDV